MWCPGAAVAKEHKVYISKATAPAALKWLSSSTMALAQYFQLTLPVVAWPLHGHVTEDAIAMISINVSWTTATSIDIGAATRRGWLDV